MESRAPKIAGRDISASLGKRDVARQRQRPLHGRGPSVKFGDIRAIDPRLDRLPVRG